ncbi:hypothetical protein ABGB18_40700 [Nonomuraea sp. B12E4]|uniref:hypothetical protein n=1 Tax=Nonomuraea sp. B12E4 TaxID=3153564 RepID=UPI00325E9DF1
MPVWTTATWLPDQSIAVGEVAMPRRAGSELTMSCSRLFAFLTAISMVFSRLSAIG